MNFASPLTSNNAAVTAAATSSSSHNHNNGNNHNNNTAVFTTAITPAEREEFLSCFNFARREGSTSDTRDREELKNLMKLLRLNPTEEEIDQMMEEVDVDNSGTIDFDEFVDVMSKTTPFHMHSSKLKQAFRMFEDEQKEGFCSIDVLREAIEYHCGEDELQNDTAELDSLLSKLDPAGTGLLKIDDFLQPITSAEQAFEDLQKEREKAVKQKEKDKEKVLAMLSGAATTTTLSSTTSKEKK